jgi:hypothetical protein
MIRKSISVVLTAIVSAGMMVTLAAAPASAAPTGCTTGGGMTYATAYCSGGTGYYQAWAQCQGTVWPYYWTFVQSDWKRAGSGQTAWVMCTAWNGGVVYTRGVARRN